jgi:pimeloyl-ACP methyl ester carboxylesterase
MHQPNLVERTRSALGRDDRAAGDTPTPDETRSTTRSFLFVHGAWHTAMHWHRVTDRLAAMGHRAAAIDLPGSGLDAAYPASFLQGDFAALRTEASALTGVRLDDYVAAVTAQLTEMARHGRVTLVGHSFGGLTITRVAEAVPHLVRRLVYVTAYVPVNQKSGAEISMLPEGGTSLSGGVLVGDPTKTGAMRINPRDPDPDYVEKARTAFYNDLPTEEFLRYAACLNPDLPLAVCMDDARGTPQRWGTVPRAFVRTTEDNTIPLALQDRMIAEADAATPDNRFVVRTLASSHSPFASMPDDLATVLADL